MRVTLRVTGAGGPKYDITGLGERMPEVGERVEIDGDKFDVKQWVWRLDTTEKQTRTDENNQDRDVYEFHRLTIRLDPIP